jgi:hypothetical protein
MSSTAVKGQGTPFDAAMANGAGVPTSFAELKIDRPKGRCAHCGQAATIRLSVVARPIMTGGGRGKGVLPAVAEDKRDYCEPCGVTVFLKARDRL